MELHDLADLAQAVGAATVVGGTIFALVQYFEYKKQRQDMVASEVMRTFIGPELAHALTVLRRYPDAVSPEKLREGGFEAEYAAVLVCMTFETLGVLVYRRIAPFHFVVELAGGIVVVMWRKLGPWLVQIRIEQRQPSWAEWFEWLAQQCERHKDEAMPAYRKHAEWKPPARRR
jgi:hypothetical protein